MYYRYTKDHNMQHDLHEPLKLDSATTCRMTGKQHESALALYRYSLTAEYSLMKNMHFIYTLYN